MGEYQIRALTGDTWDAFAALCERNGGGGFGGCWCCYFHNATSPERRAAGGDDWRGYKERLVREDGAHAALVFDGDDAIGWCQYGSPAELPGITHQKEVAASGLPPADYRLGCFFVDRRYRGNGVSAAALAGALRLIAEQGGGVVEAYPYDTGDKKVSSTFLYNSTRETCERAGFSYELPKGKNHCIMRKVVNPA